MTGLVLKLGPTERLLINGAVIENGPKRGRLNILTPGANILRLRDAIHPEQANTPVGRLCYTTQLVLSGDHCMAEVSAKLLEGIDQVAMALRDLPSHEALATARRAVVENQPYHALKALRSLLGTEAALLSLSRP